jgi:hypothetical protein
VRAKIVLGLLISFFAAFGALLALRKPLPHEAPAAPRPPSAPSAEPALSSSAVASSSAASALASARPADAGADGGAPKLLDRPLRVVTLGWDLLAPALLENDGLVPGAKSGFTAAGIDVRLGAITDMAGIEKALARGGAEDGGADVAIMPLPALAASYERLRALSPEAFLVVGFSRGREALVSKRDALPEPPASGEVKLAGVAGEASTFLALFLLDAAGIPPARVRLVSPSEADQAAVAAVIRGAAPAGARPLLTSADTPRLIPYVAVAQRGLLDVRSDALAALGRGWLAGSRKLAADPPAGARRVAAAAGASDPLSFVERLGELSPASLSDNARMAGLSGREALTLDALFQRSWALWRGVGALATPAPDRAPIATQVIASLALSEGVAREPDSAGKAPAGWEKGRALLVHRQEKLDQDALVNAAGTLAATFERAVVRVGVQRGPVVDTLRTKGAIDAVVGRFDVAPARVVPATKGAGKGAAVLEVLMAP